MFGDIKIKFDDFKQRLRKKPKHLKHTGPSKGSTESVASTQNINVIPATPQASLRTSHDHLPPKDKIVVGVPQSSLTRYAEGAFPASIPEEFPRRKSSIELSTHHSTPSIVLPDPLKGECKGTDIEILTPFDTLAGSDLNIRDTAPAPLLTEGGLTTCGDGGHDYEKQFLSTKSIGAQLFVDCESLLEVVEDVLHDAKVENAMNPTRDFIPCTSLHEIITHHTVRLLIRHCDETLDDRQAGDYASRIAPCDDEFAPSFRRVFAILILLNKPKTIFDFVEAEVPFDDSQLPIYNNRTDAPLPSIFMNWKKRHVKEFCRIQWEVWPLFFSVLKNNRVVHYECRPGEILPLMSHETWKLNKIGGYGEVACYALHPDQQSLIRYTVQGLERPVAVKKLYRANTKEAFDQEYYMLDRLTHSLKTPHLAKLLLTFEVPKSGDNSGPRDYFLVFECADCNLSDLWAKEAPDETTAPRWAEWVALQSLGLAKALDGIHDFERNKRSDDWNDRTHGFHGDLKPDNILLYKGWEGQEHPYGILQITDFGLSSFHNTQTAENIKFSTQAGDYRPPEAQLVLNVSHSLDVWALGCISLEFLTWLVMGPAGLKTFEQRRTLSRGFFASSHTCFWQVVEKDNMTTVSLAQAVIDHTTELCRSSKTSNFIRDFCEVIINRMLVVEDKGIIGQTSDGTGDSKQNTSPPVKRIEAFDLKQELDTLASKDKKYYTPCPYPNYPSFDRLRHCIQVPKALHVLLEEAQERYEGNMANSTDNIHP